MAEANLEFVQKTIGEEIEMKKVKALMLAALVMAGIAITPAANAASQLWGAGAGDAIGITWISGSYLSDPAMSSTAAGWTEVGNASYAFASFDAVPPLGFLEFYVNLVGADGKFILYEWSGETLVDSVLASLHDVEVYPYAVGAPTRNEQFLLSGGTVPTVPEPGALGLLALGLVGLVGLKKRNSGIAPTT